jgi:hypothetical protein
MTESDIEKWEDAAFGLRLDLGDFSTKVKKFGDLLSTVKVRLELLLLEIKRTKEGKQEDAPRSEAARLAQLALFE